MERTGQLEETHRDLLATREALVERTRLLEVTNQDLFATRETLIERTRMLERTNQDSVERTRALEDMLALVKAIRESPFGHAFRTTYRKLFK